MSSGISVTPRLGMGGKDSRRCLAKAGASRESCRRRVGAAKPDDISGGIREREQTAAAEGNRGRQAQTRRSCSIAVVLSSEGERLPSYQSSLLSRECIADHTLVARGRRPPGLTFHAGQYVDLVLPDPPRHDVWGNLRTFSIASAPYEPDLEILMRVSFYRVQAGTEYGGNRGSGRVERPRWKSSLACRHQPARNLPCRRSRGRAIYRCSAAGGA
jgi:hypothetical protein